MPPLPQRVLAMAAAVVVATAAGCTSPETTQPPPAPEDADAVVLGTDAFEYIPDEVQLPAGGATVSLQCEQALPHNIEVELADGDRRVVECAGGETATGDVDLPAGTYAFFCSIPGHRQAGMEGVLSVG